MAGCYLPPLKFESEAAARAYDAEVMADMKYRLLVARASMHGLKPMSEVVDADIDSDMGYQVLPFDDEDGDDVEFLYDGGRLGVVR